MVTEKLLTISAVGPYTGSHVLQIQKPIHQYNRVRVYTVLLNYT